MTSHVTFPTDKWQSVNKHINRLKKWRENRLRRDLDVIDLSNAIALADEHLRVCLGFRHGAGPTGKDASPMFPSISVGFLEQIQQALILAGEWDERPNMAHVFNVARKNIETCIEEAKNVNGFRWRETVEELKEIASQ